MKKRKFKKYVIPTCFLIFVGLMSFGITVLSKNLLDKKIERDEHYNYTMSVFNESEDTELKEAEKIVVQKPFTSDNVSIAKEFYSN